MNQGVANNNALQMYSKGINQRTGLVCDSVAQCVSANRRTNYNIESKNNNDKKIIGFQNGL